MGRAIRGELVARGRPGETSGRPHRQELGRTRLMSTVAV